MRNTTYDLSVSEHLDSGADTRRAFLVLQESTTRLLAHGAADADELRTLARMCDVPCHVLRADLIGEVR